MQARSRKVTEKNKRGGKNKVWKTDLLLPLFLLGFKVDKLLFGDSALTMYFNGN